MLRLVFLLLLTSRVLAAAAEECGKVKIRQSQSLIIGTDAIDSNPGQWPWLAPLFRFGGYVCGSSLISSQHLLTAAHCIAARDYKNFCALLGRFDLANDSETHWVNRTMSHLFVHRDYNNSATGFKSKADIAVLRMRQRVDFTDFIRPVCLPPAGVSTNSLEGVVVGYGFYKRREHEHTPKQVAMHSIDSFRCIFMNKLYSDSVSEQSFCARGNLAAPCTGDSGGGYYGWNGVEQRYTTFGIVSRAATEECDPEEYTIFVDVPKYAEWIAEKIRQDVPDDEDEDITAVYPCRKLEVYGQVQCLCPIGYFGQWPFCREFECESDDDCPTRDKCSAARSCVDPCEDEPCADSALCVAAPGHSFRCRCFRGYESDGHNGCEPVTIVKFALTTTVKPDPCQLKICGPFAKCTLFNGIAVCNCNEGFVGRPPACRQPECFADADCLNDNICTDFKCIDLCAAKRCVANTICEIEARQALCRRCIAGFRNNGRGQCFLNPYLIDGTEESEECDESYQEDVLCEEDDDQTLPTFVVADGVRIHADDFEIAPKFKSDDIKKLKVGNFDWTSRTNPVRAKFLPVKVDLLFPNLMFYEAKFMQISKVSRENFRKLTKLKLLSLFYNQLSTIDVPSFSDLRELILLDLSSNKLSNIGPQHFASLRQLTFLFLNENQLKTLPENVFESLRQLRILKLQTNKILSLSDKTFASLENLKEIYLQHNQLTTLPDDVFAHNPNIVQIWLWNNDIAKIPFKVFEGKERLVYVGLWGNNCINKAYGSFYHDAAPLTIEQREELRNDVENSCSAFLFV